MSDAEIDVAWVTSCLMMLPCELFHQTAFLMQKSQLETESFCENKLKCGEEELPFRSIAP